MALFLGDYFARASKRSGAWMSAFRCQEKLDGDVRPIIVNVLNFAKPGAGEPALLSIDEARTLFHEFGHGLHGMLSDVTYPRIAGTSVSSDFVELPSQLYEHWLTQPQVLRSFARHARTGEADAGGPAAAHPGDAHVQPGLRDGGILLVGLRRSRFPRAEASGEGGRAGVQARQARGHRHAAPRSPCATRRRISAMCSRARDTRRGYYCYLWSEVLDADAFEAFEETGDIFNADVARKLRDYIYAAGGRREPADAYIAFRGRLPNADALLKKRGLLEVSAEV